MAPQSSLRIDPVDALRGMLSEGSGWAGLRLSAETLGRIPADTAAAARVPAGVRLELQGAADAVELELIVGERAFIGSPTLPLQISVWVDDAYRACVEVTPSTTSVVLPLKTTAVSLITVYLPEAEALSVTSITARGGVLRAAPRRPRFIAYGDSITQGWSTTDVGATWPAIVARQRQLDLVNLGFAGSARGELPVAFEIAESALDLVVVAWGTNSWSTIPADSPSIASTMRLFLTAIRAQNPGVPLLVVSPIIRPAAEAEPNVFGATLRDLRDAIETTVLGLSGDDSRLALLPGLDLVPEGELVDGVHPGDAGHARLAEQVSNALSRLLDRPSA